MLSCPVFYSSLKRFTASKGNKASLNFKGNKFIKPFVSIAFLKPGAKWSKFFIVISGGSWDKKGPKRAFKYKVITGKYHKSAKISYKDLSSKISLSLSDFLFIKPS